jgi:hypothetical protein
MFRFLLVRGVRGHLVANPHTDPMARRFLGKQPSGVFWEAGEDPVRKVKWPRAEEVEEVVQDDASLRKAHVRGGIVILKECTARDMEDARNQLLPKQTET